MNAGNGNQTENRQTGDMILAPGIVRNTGRMSGRATLAGTRITVSNILRRLAGGQTEEDVLRAYPHLTHRQILDAFNYGAQLVEANDPALFDIDSLPDIPEETIVETRHVDATPAADSGLKGTSTEHEVSC